MELCSLNGGIYIHHRFTDLHKQDASNYDIFKKSVEPLVDLCIAGFNTCLVITGESGSGKAYAAAGESSSKSGIVPIIIEHLFAKIGDGKHLYINEPDDDYNLYLP